MTEEYPSILNMIRTADLIIAADEARQRARTVPQEPWPTDGSLPRAEHVVVWQSDPADVDEFLGEAWHEVLWTGRAFGIEATCVVRNDPDVVLYVKATVERNGPRDWYGHVRLVTAKGKVLAHSFLTNWWCW